MSTPDPPTSAARWFAGLVRPHARRLSGAAVALVLSSSAVLLLPVLAGRLTDAALSEKSQARLSGFVLGLIALFAAFSILGYAKTYLLQSTAARIVQRLRAKLHAHLLTLTSSFFETQRTGALLSRLGTDVQALGSALTKELVEGLHETFLLIGALVILFVTQLQLTALMVLAAPPVIIFAVIFGRRLERISQLEQDAEAEGAVVAEEALSGIRSVQAFACEPDERARYEGRLASIFALRIRETHTLGLFVAVVSFMSLSGFALVAWYGGSVVIEGALSAGQLTSFLLYTKIIADAAAKLTTLWGSLKTASGATQRVREILATRAAVHDAPQARPLVHPRGRVVWRDVTFRYATAVQPAINGVSLEVERGRILALVGPSGGGKTTLISMLLRFHDPQQGAVEIDGNDVRDVRLVDLRRAIGFVPQDVFLFGGTIAENIRYGSPGSDEIAVRAAAEAAQAHTFIERLPEGYATVVGERGIRLSVGERQRLAIARVFLKDPAIVVLDEATSALDAESEHLVQRALERLLENRTTVIIAHRLTTVRRAHKVAVIDGGRVVEVGTHDDLILGGGLYRRFVELQMSPDLRAATPGAALSDTVIS